LQKARSLRRQQNAISCFTLLKWLDRPKIAIHASAKS
jgi:hypothetical protein